MYNGSTYYVLWNDQFYEDPQIDGCTKSCDSPWGYSKGMVAWDKDGNGFVLQVSTPSWPASGSKEHPRKTDGNTLGCIHDNDMKVSQHFFALKLTKFDLLQILAGLKNASVATNVQNPQIVHNGGPKDVQALVLDLGVKSSSNVVFKAKLSSGVTLISKPSKLHVPPWQLVSAQLGGVPLRAATWWSENGSGIPTITTARKPGCWDMSLSTPGPVEIATTGQWNGKVFSLEGLLGKNDANHAKIGVLTDKSDLVIFGDLNQDGALYGDKYDCGKAQNGRGGLFFVVKDTGLHESVQELIKGESAYKLPYAEGIVD